MTPTPGFKVTLFFDAEYLRNGTRYIVSMNTKGGGALCAGNAVALLVFGPVMP